MYTEGGDLKKKKILTIIVNHTSKLLSSITDNQIVEQFDSQYPKQEINNLS
jgi:hypothetical protein